jgi:pyridoxal phosphate phosphatase PHOSPHO2
MMVDCGVTVSQLNKCLCNIPIFEENLMALKLAKTAGWQNFILSDANHHYIDVILQHHDINSSFIEIATNGSRVESTESSSSIGGVTVSGEMTRLRIYPHQSIEAPHSCSLCPQNLCKGNVLDKWREEHSFSKVVYIGDGGGDFCPVVRLKAGDVALCRRNYTLHKMCIAATSEVASDAVAGHRVEAHVVEWSNGQDILSCFRDVCKTVSDVDDSKL